VAEKTSVERQEASGSAHAPGGGKAPQESPEGMSHGQETYPGPRKGGEQDRPPNTSTGPGDSQPLNSAFAVEQPVDAGTIRKGGVDISSDTYETPDGQSAPDYSADQLGNETGANGDTPAAGDVDPDSTYVAEETGQDGDPTRDGKSTAHPWNH
jgi:hypothetical protein